MDGGFVGEQDKVPLRRLGNITHVSLDGLTTPLGQSQVLAVSERMQIMGWQCTIVSLEPPAADRSSIQSVRERLARSGVRWHYHPYRCGFMGAVCNVAAMTEMMRRVSRETDIFHCRSYFGAFLPALGNTIADIPYVFDTRGYWIDEKMEAGRWFQRPAARTVARRVERELYGRASGVVTLTELAADDVRCGRFGRKHQDLRAVCIPTCVDYTRFVLEKAPAPHPIVTEGPVVAYVGSINPSYESRKSVELASMVLDWLPSARFLALTGQRVEMATLADEYGIPESRRLITQVPFDESGRWLPWIDFGLMLLVDPNFAKRASMPTKLGEFFATGVAPICHGGNSEIGQWVRKTGSGLTLDDLSDESLLRAAEFIISGPPSIAVARQARETAEEHFSLQSGAERYDALFRDILM